MQFANTKSSIPDERIVRVRILGTGAADPTVQIGQKVSVTHTATGVYKFTFNDNNGTFVGLAGAPLFGATTPGDVKGQTCTRGAFTDPTATAAGFVSLSIWSSTFSADDLQATETLDVAFVFTENSEVA